jgi:hypothetical protein
MSSQPEYNVGDVLYVFDNDKQRIVPIQVVSITSKRTINGEEISYEIVTPARLDKPASLDRVPGAIYTSLIDLRQYMLENAQRAIDSMVQRAADVATQSFVPSKVAVDDGELVLSPEPISAAEAAPAPSAPTPAGKMRVHMPDGTIEYVDAGEQLSV